MIGTSLDRVHNGLLLKCISITTRKLTTHDAFVIAPDRRDTKPIEGLPPMRCHRRSDHAGCEIPMINNPCSENV
jgi:hypothetical protein